LIICALTSGNFTFVYADEGGPNIILQKLILSVPDRKDLELDLKGIIRVVLMGVFYYFNALAFFTHPLKNASFNSNCIKYQRWFELKSLLLNLY